MESETHRSDQGAFSISHARLEKERAAELAAESSRDFSSVSSPEGSDFSSAQYRSDKRRQAARDVAIDSMERYSGSSIEDFSQYLMITNFPAYVEAFAQERGIQIYEGSGFKVAHSRDEGVSILDYKMGAPMAALVMDLCAHLDFKGILMLGMAGGLRDRFQIGDYFVPTGSIRAEGTSDQYYPPQFPALGNFVIQRVITQELEAQGIPYHLGITYTTSRRFWEFNQEFIESMMKLRPHAIEMECATLFTAGFRHKIPIGALLLVSDTPLKVGGVKTKESAKYVFDTFTKPHVQLGVRIIHRLQQWQKNAVGSRASAARNVTRDGPGAVTPDEGVPPGEKVLYPKFDAAAFHSSSALDVDSRKVKHPSAIHTSDAMSAQESMNSRLLYGGESIAATENFHVTQSQVDDSCGLDDKRQDTFLADSAGDAPPRRTNSEAREREMPGEICRGAESLCSLIFDDHESQAYLKCLNNYMQAMEEYEQSSTLVEKSSDASSNEDEESASEVSNPMQGASDLGHTQPPGYTQPPGHTQPTDC